MSETLAMFPAMTVNVQSFQTHISRKSWQPGNTVPEELWCALGFCRVGCFCLKCFLSREHGMAFYGKDKTVELLGAILGSVRNPSPCLSCMR